MQHPRALCALLVAGIALALPAYAHQHVAHAATPPPGAGTAVRHPTDAALRSAMGRVRNAVEAFEHARHGHMGTGQVLALTAHLDEQVSRLVSECRLEPSADASMHVLLARLLEANGKMRAKPDVYAPVAAMEQVLADYARVFDDPGAHAPTRP